MRRLPGRLQAVSSSLRVNWRACGASQPGAWRGPQPCERRASGQTGRKKKKRGKGGRDSTRRPPPGRPKLPRAHPAWTGQTSNSPLAGGRPGWRPGGQPRRQALKLLSLGDGEGERERRACFFLFCFSARPRKACRRSSASTRDAVARRPPRSIRRTLAWAAVWERQECAGARGAGGEGSARDNTKK